MSDVRLFTCESPGERLDRFLANRCTDLSRTRIKRTIAEGDVTVDGQEQNAGFRLRPGQTVSIVIPDPAPTHLIPQQIPLNIVHDDEDLLIVDKPAGMPVHPGVGHPDSTLVNAVLGLDSSIGEVGGTMRPGLVHRLDMDTSGLIAIAKTDRTHASITRQLRDRTVNKGYLALVAGTLSPVEAVIDAPIGRDPHDRKKMAIVEDGRPASTPYRTIGIFRGCTYAEVSPKTGRTHQIRVHFASIDHPVIGDALYGREDPRIGRHFLHAAYLEFDHPADGRRVHFRSPLPSELQSLIDSLEN